MATRKPLCVTCAKGRFQPEEELSKHLLSEHDGELLGEED